MSVPVVLDASAVLALAHGEPGCDVIEPLVDGACLSSVNWSEVGRVCVAAGRRPAALRAVIEGAGCEIVDFTTADAEMAAMLWPRTRSVGLSIGDRACLALARRLSRPAVTTDRAWLEVAVGIEVICAR